MNRWLYAVAGLFAVALIAVTVVFTLRNDELDDRIGDLESMVEEIEEEGSDPDAAAELADVRSRLRKMEQCLPELQTELDSLEVDFGFASPTTQISQFCTEILRPTPAGE